jgi:hypothetical protein
LDKFYSDDGLEHCLYKSGPADIDGYGNQIINVKNNSGIITQAFVLFDSHAYAKGFFRDYDNIHQNQIDWYEREITRLDFLNRANGAEETIKSLAFFHIPLTEQRDAWFEYADKGNSENVKLLYGTAGESGAVVYSGIGDDELFETMLRLGSTKGVFTGHDHLNNFSIEYNGGSGDKTIRLTYGMSIDYLAYPGIYKQVTQRGGTVITVFPDGEFDCYGLRLQGLEVID